MKLWRVVHVDHIADPWSGEGGRRVDGRWHSAGRPIVYASEHAALAVLEKLVHVGRREMRAFRLASATLPAGLVLPVPRLPARWARSPAPPEARAIGDVWLAAGTSVALRVPSSLVPGTNVLLDPTHGDFHQLARGEIQTIPFAQRAD